MFQQNRGGYSPRLSIIIVSYNTCDVTDQCLKSVYSAKWRDDFEVIVVDNNSSDGSVDMIRSKYPQVKLIANPNNKLFAIANNQGAKIANGEYLLLLNSDTIVYDDNLQRLIDFFDKQPKDVICIGPKILNPDKSLQSGPHPRSGIIEHFFHLTHAVKILPFLKCFFPTLPSNPYKVQRAGWIMGCAMMIRSKEYKEVGGLNEAIEFYGEEPEFGYRTDRLGYKTIYYPEAEIIHLGGISTKKKEGLNPEEEEARKARDLRRYEKLIQQTTGYDKAINTAKATIFAYRLLWCVSRNPYFKDAIKHEKEVICYLKARRK